MGRHLGARLALLAEASVQVGMGHLMEMRAVQAVADAAGIPTRLVVTAGAPVGPSTTGGGPVVRVPDLAPESLRAVASDLVIDGCRAVVTDVRWITNAQVAALEGAGLRVVCVDELGGKQLDCEVVINTSIVEAWHRYSSAHPRFRLYAGPRYLPLAPDYGLAAGRGRHVAGPVQRVVITLGGADPSGATAHVLETLNGRWSTLERSVVVGPGFSAGHRRRIRDLARWDPNLVVSEDLRGLAPVLAEADLVVTAGGNTLYECACLGVPALVLWEAPHERLQGEAFERAGFGRCAGQGDRVAAGVVLDAIAAFDDPEVRRAHGAVGSRLVDGLGAERVCDLAREVAGLGVGRIAPASAAGSRDRTP